MSDKRCATCRWVWDEAGLPYARRFAAGAGTVSDSMRLVSCRQRESGAAIQCWPDQGGCPRWERKEDLADKIAKACLVEFRRYADPEDNPEREQRILSAVAAVIRPLLEEGKP